jgi:hypothetical protein
MKKVILSFTLAFAIIFGSSAYAQTLDQKSKEAAPAIKKEVKTEAQKADPGQLKQQNPQQNPEHKKLTPQEKATKVVERISQKVKDLTPDQIKKLTDLHVKSYTQMDKDRAALKDDKVKTQEAMKTETQKLNDGIKGILTPEQFKAYTAPSDKPKTDPNAAKKTDKKPAAAKETTPVKEEKK